MAWDSPTEPGAEWPGPVRFGPGTEDDPDVSEDERRDACNGERAAIRRDPLRSDDEHDGERERGARRQRQRLPNSTARRRATPATATTAAGSQIQRSSDASTEAPRRVKKPVTLIGEMRMTSHGKW